LPSLPPDQAGGFHHFLPLGSFAAAGLILQAGDRMAAPEMQMPAHAILGTPLKTNFAPVIFL
jgi:hypothetical protein